MTARQNTAPAHTWRSGYCGTGDHEHCRGAYAGAACRCDCHAARLDALNTARLAVSDAAADLAQARADLAHQEMRYGDALTALNRAIDDVVYGPPPAAKTPGGTDA